MRTMRAAWLGLTAIIPAGAALAMQTVPADDVPDVRLNAPDRVTGAWGPGGWRGDASGPLPPVVPRDAAPSRAGRGGAPAPLVAGRGPAEAAFYAGRGDERRWARGPALTRGTRLPPEFLSPGYALPDPRAYGLPAPGPGAHWVRHYDAAALVDEAGYVRDVRDPMDWGPGYGGGDYAVGYGEGWEAGAAYGGGAIRDRGRRREPYRGYPPAYGYGYGSPAYGYGGPAYGGYGAGAPLIYSDDGGSGVVVPGASTTTVVEETTYEDASGNTTWRAPVRREIRRPAPR